MADDLEDLKQRVAALESRVAQLESGPQSGGPHRVDVAVFNDSRNPATATVTQTQYAFADRNVAANPTTDPLTQTQYAFSDRGEGGGESSS